MDTMISGVFAGICSSTVQSPFQLVEINQQRFGGNMVVTLQRILTSYGVVGMNRGLSMTAVREGIFCWGYIAMAPLIKQVVREKYPETSEKSALAVGAVVSGTIAGVLSHPADALKTRLQASVFDENRPKGARE